MILPTRIIPLAVAALLIASAPAHALLVAEVRDEAGLFKPETVKRADEIIRALKHDHNQDLLIETYAGIPKDREAAWAKVHDNQEKRAEFFAQWGRERFKTAEVNGIYILITKDPGHVQIEVGNITAEKTFTMANRDHLRDLMLDDFKKKEFDAGLLAGVEYVQKSMDANLKAPKKGGFSGGVPPGDYPAPTEHPSLFSPGNWMGWLCIGLAVLAIIWVVFAIFRGLSRAGGGYASGGYSGAPGYGGGYGYGPGGGGGGGFLSGMLGGLFGGAAGGWLYDRFFRGESSAPAAPPEVTPAQPPQQDTDATGTGGDFGGDNGGTEAGGGEYGGDTGGTESGGGDFGGDTGGGGDFGGGGDVGGGGDTGGGGDF